MSLNGALLFYVNVKLKCGDLLMFSVASPGLGGVRRRAVMFGGGVRALAPTDVSISGKGGRERGTQMPGVSALYGFLLGSNGRVCLPHSQD